MGNISTLKTDNTMTGILTPATLDEAMRMAGEMAKSSIIPKDYQGNPGNILVAMQWGAELGLAPLQAMQNIAVINGRPSIWGDAVMALVRTSPACEYIKETFEGEGQNLTAICRVKRKGQGEEEVRTFSWQDAVTAGLTNKTGPWKQYPKRMLQMRARAFALRDVFADLLKGMPIAEEVQDIPERDITPQPQQKACPTQDRPALPSYAQADFEKFAPKWHEAIKAGKRSPDEIIAMAESKAALSEEQKQIILSMEVEHADS